ncbi:hypothetical protein ABT373_34625 [Streptomyces sp. NPDC000070]|uniref:hypothetical protein n=1 Tax=Streptomyces sp. NPDC000070 TaxID=3154240 RepID=UPI0033254EF5
MAGVYLTAALLKINDEHLLTERSASRVVTAHYPRLLRLPIHPGLLTAVPFAVVAVEFAVGVLLLVPGGEPWSFAMFTSLRPFGRSWLERYRARDWPRYYALTLPGRIPTSLLREIGPEFIYSATRSRNVVHEGVVYHLEATARKFHVSFPPER